MSTDLIDYLERTGAVSREDLDQAEKRLAELGGRIDTALLELGVIDEHGLAKVLSDAFGLPVATMERLKNVDKKLLSLFGKRYAERYNAVPIEADDRTITIAMLDPSDLMALDEIRFLTDRSVRPLAISEFRLRWALKEMYGADLETRFIELERKLAGPSAGDEREPEPKMPSLPDQNEIEKRAREKAEKAEKEALKLKARIEEEERQQRLQKEYERKKFQETRREAERKALDDSWSRYLQVDKDLLDKEREIVESELAARIAASSRADIRGDGSEVGSDSVLAGQDAGFSATGPVEDEPGPDGEPLPWIEAVAEEEARIIEEEESAGRERARARQEQEEAAALEEIESGRAMPAAPEAETVHAEADGRSEQGDRVPETAERGDAERPAEEAGAEPRVEGPGAAEVEKAVHEQGHAGNGEEVGEGAVSEGREAVQDGNAVEEPEPVVGESEDSGQEPGGEETVFKEQEAARGESKSGEKALVEEGVQAGDRGSGNLQGEAGLDDKEFDKLIGADSRAKEPERKYSSVAEAIAAMAMTDSRDKLIAVALDYLAGIFGYAAFFVFDSRSVRGLDARGDGTGGEALKEVNVNLDQPSFFRTVRDIKAHYHGPVPPQETSENLCKALDRGRPGTVLIVPVLLKDRVVGALYVDSNTGNMDVSRLPETLSLADGLAENFRRIIAERKTSRQAVHGRPAAEATEGGTGRIIAEQVEVGADSGMEAVEEEVIELSLSSALPGYSRSSENIADVSVSSSGPGEERFPGIGTSLLTREVSERKERIQARAGEWRDSLNMAKAPPRMDAGRVPDGDVGDTLASSLKWRQDLSQGMAGEGGPDTAEEKPTGPGTAEQLVRGGLAPASLKQLLTELEEGGPREQERAFRFFVENPDESIPLLLEVFPGRLLFNELVEDEPADLRDHSMVLRCLLDIGTPAVPGVLALLKHEDWLKRFYAVRFFAKHKVEDALEALAGVLDDPDPRVSHEAQLCLKGYRSFVGYKDFLENMRSRLNSDDDFQVLRAARILADAGDRDAVPIMIELIKKRKSVSESVAEVLKLVAMADFGTNYKKWKKWWKKYRDKPETEWLIDGLESDDEEVRAAAIERLREQTGMDFGFFATDDKRARRTAVKKWKAWWQNVNK